MKPWLAGWRAITNTRASLLAATVIVGSVLGLGYLVIAHRYKIGFRSTTTTFELAPADPPAVSDQPLTVSSPAP